MANLRARSDGAKQRRRLAILATSDQLLRADGFDALTMSKLAAACGLAKGTLYLYFATREELMLSLYTDLNEVWMDRFLAVERADNMCDYGAVCVRFYQSFSSDQLLVELAARATSIFEPHVPQASWISAKQAQGRIAKRLAGMFHQKFECEPVPAQRLAWAFLVALSGAQQRAINVNVRADIPDQIRKATGVMSCLEVFLNIVLPLSPKVQNCRPTDKEETR